MKPALLTKSQTFTSLARVILSRCSIAALTELISFLSTHFQHEETIMASKGFGSGAAAGISGPLESHKADHKRILDFANDQRRQALANGTELVHRNCASKIAELFVFHANEFDARFEGRL